MAKLYSDRKLATKKLLPKKETIQFKLEKVFGCCKENLL